LYQLRNSGAQLRAAVFYARSNAEYASAREKNTPDVSASSTQGKRKAILF
jgi:hypothetical protein